MKKLFVVCMGLMLTLTLSAQHVNSIAEGLVDFNLTSLRSEYPGPSDYLGQLRHLALKQKADAALIKEAHKELREARQHLGSMTVCVDESQRTLDKLEKFYNKELKEKEELDELMNKQQTAIRQSVHMDEATRERFLSILNERRQRLAVSIADVQGRIAALEEERPQLDKARETLEQMQLDVKQKTMDLKEAEQLMKDRHEKIQSEIKIIEPLAKAERRER